MVPVLRAYLNLDFAAVALVPEHLEPQLLALEVLGHCPEFLPATALFRRENSNRPMVIVEASDLLELVHLEVVCLPFLALNGELEHARFCH